MTAREGYYLERVVRLASHSGYGSRVHTYEQRYVWTGIYWSEHHDHRLTLWGTESDALAVFGAWRRDIAAHLDFDRMAPPEPLPSSVRLRDAHMTVDDMVDERKLEMSDDDRRLWPSRAKRW